MVYQSYRSAMSGSETNFPRLDLNNPAIRRHIQTALSQSGIPYTSSFHNQYLNRVGLQNSFVVIQKVLFNMSRLQKPPSLPIDDFNTPENIATHGWTPIAADANAIFKGRPYLHKPDPLLVADMKFPDDDVLVQKIQEFAKDNLPIETYNHCMRAYYFATAIIRQQFPTTYSSTKLSPSTLAITCLLHDMGTTRVNRLQTQMSFEFQSAYLVTYLLLSAPEFEGLASISQAEAIAEAVHRHQDLAPPGSPAKISFLGQIIQLATLYDNVGKWPYLISKETRDDVNDKFKRLGWGGCFADVIREEIKRKPWCTSTKIGEEEFVNGVEGNVLMSEYP